MLNHILRAGDRVRMKMDSESRNWGRPGVEDGVLGTITGRHRATGIIESRYPCLTREPGIYAKDAGILVQWDEYPEGADPSDMEYNHVNAVWLEPADSFLKEYKARLDAEWPVRLANGEVNPDFDIIKVGDKLDNLERIGDLPETEFWELDIVSWNGIRHRICRVNYNRWGPERLHCYDMEEVDENNVYHRTGSTTVDPSELILIERGNVWREAHGEPAVFRDLDEETAFATNMGRSTSVRNPANNLYCWNLDEVLEAIRNGLADGFTNGTPLFSTNPRINARIFHDRELGERVRAETLKGFDVALS